MTKLLLIWLGSILSISVLIFSSFAWAKVTFLKQPVSLPFLGICISSLSYPCSNPNPLYPTSISLNNTNTQTALLTYRINTVIDDIQDIDDRTQIKAKIDIPNLPTLSFGKKTTIVSYNPTSKNELPIKRENLKIGANITMDIQYDFREKTWKITKIRLIQKKI